MVDFVRETLIDVPGAAERCRVVPDTVYRWMKRGLEHAKVGGKVLTSLEAIQRFSGQCAGTQPQPQLSSDTAKGLKEYGITIGR